MIKMKTGRIIVTYKCPKNCVGCCNKDWKYDPPKPITHYDYDEIVITGGEPLLFPDKVIALAKEIKEQSTAKILLYTAKTEGFMEILPYVDGITFTLHDPEDVFGFNFFCYRNYQQLVDSKKSLRLNIFKEAIIHSTPLYSYLFNTKEIVWKKDCPLPKNEELLCLKKLW